MNQSWLAEHLPEAERLVDAATIDGVTAHEFVETLLASDRERPGRRRTLSVRTLFVALQLGAFSGQYFLIALPRLLSLLSATDRRRLGLAVRGPAVTYRQLCYLLTRVDQVLRQAFVREGGRIVGGLGAFDALFNAVATAGIDHSALGSSSIAVDGSDIPTWGSWKTRHEPAMTTNENGEVVPVLNADGTVHYEKVRVISDADAAWRGAKNPEGKKPHFGYALTVAVSVPEEGEDPVARVAVAARFRPTTVQDREMGLACVGEFAQRRGGLGDVLVDRGYTPSKHGADFVLPIRAMGGEPIFDLTVNQLGPAGTVRGAVIIEGRPYSPSIPRNLLRLSPPSTGEDGTYKPNPEKLRAYQAAVAAREVYALVPHGSRRESGGQVFQCPGAAGKLDCPLQPARKGLRSGALPVLNSPAHPAPGSVCANAYPTFTLDELPLFQRHTYGSRAWFDSYARRSASVEPFFGAVKDGAGAGVARGRIRVMGLVKTGLLVAFAVASTSRRHVVTFDPEKVRARRESRRRGRPAQTRTLTLRRIVESAATPQLVLRT